MTSRERVNKALNKEPLDRLPRQVWITPSVGGAAQDILAKYPQDIAFVGVKIGKSPYEHGEAYKTGSRADVFGNIWVTLEDGVAGEIKEPILADWNKLDTYKLPWEIYKNADYAALNEQCASAREYCVVVARANPFEQLQMLRGPENLYMDLGAGEPKLNKLIDMLHEFILYNIKKVCECNADAIHLSDDWGTQTSSLISVEMWKEIFKPLYVDYIRHIRAKGKKVFFHSDGFIETIYPELVDIGVDALNSQLFCMDIEKLVDNYGDKITFWGELDRQYTLPFGTVHDVYNAVDRLYKAIMNKHGKLTGMIAQFEWGKRVPAENVAAALERWDHLAANGF